MQMINKYKWVLLGVLLGGLGGYLYYTLYGCNTGSCAITGSPINSIAYGALIGGLLFSSIKQPGKNQDKKEKEQEGTISH